MPVIAALMPASVFGASRQAPATWRQYCFQQSWKVLDCGDHQYRDQRQRRRDPKERADERTGLTGAIAAALDDCRSSAGKFLIAESCPSTRGRGSFNIGVAHTVPRGAPYNP